MYLQTEINDRFRLFTLIFRCFCFSERFQMYPILGVYISDFDSLNMNEILKRNAVDTFSNENV